MMSTPNYECWLRRAIVLALLPLLFAGCHRETGGGGSTSSAAGPHVTADPGPSPAAVTIAYTGNFHGFQKPCGCALKQNGGLYRLGTIMRHLHERFVGAEAAPPADVEGNPVYQLPEGVELPQPLWYVECGNFSDPQALYPAERTRTYLKTLEYLIPSGFKAAVPGSAELQLSEEQVREAFSDSAVPVVSCNLSCDSKVLAVKPYQQMAEGWYVTGVTNWAPAVISPPAERWWELSDPVMAVRAVLAELPKDARVVVVAMYQSRQEIQALAELPIAALIGHGSDLDKQWAAGLAPAVGGPPAKGITLRLVSLAGGGGGEPMKATSWSVEETEDWADDPQIVALVMAERQTVKERLRAQLLKNGGQGWKNVDWGNAKEYLPDKESKWELYIEAPPAYVGSRECRTCHPSSYEVWEDTAHARALISLSQHGDDESLDCLKCHVTGLLEDTGFTPFKTDERVSGVTCEKCHGPGSVHVGLMALHRETDDLHIELGSLKGCASCHDSYNSPDFEPKSYWDAIKHVDRRLHREQ